MARKLSGTTMPKKRSAEIKRKLEALDEVAGLVNDLPPEELRAFLEMAKRRPLFEAKASE